jgi:hypothetical protein
MPTPTTAEWAKIDKSGLPDVHSLNDERLQVLWVLAAAKRGPEVQGLSANAISEILRDGCGIAMSRQRVAGILQSETRCVARQGNSNPPRYLIMRYGEDELLGSGFRPMFIDPSQALTSIRAVEQLFGELQGNVRVCDTYVDSRTIDYLALSSAASSVRLLTENIQDNSRFKRDLGAFAKQHMVPLEVRAATPGQFHDRYVLHDNGMYLLGSSLKDIGKKQSIIVTLPTDFSREMSKAFERLWATATKI